MNSPESPNSSRSDSHVNDIDWLLDLDRGFVVYFRPRCGSTTLTRWFFENLGVKFGGFSISAYRKDWLSTRWQKLEDYLNQHYDNLHKFVVVRNPFERAVSSYLHVVNNPLDSQWSVVKPFVEEDLEKHDFTFRQWVKYLQVIDLDCAHIIWRRQSALSCWKRGVNDVVTLDRMNDYLLAMNKRFGLAAKPTFNSVTVPEKEKRFFRNWYRGAKFYGDTPFCDLLAFKGKTHFQEFPDYSQFYDKSLRAAVSEIYAADIAIFQKAINTEHSFSDGQYEWQ